MQSKSPHSCVYSAFLCRKVATMSKCGSRHARAVVQKYLHFNLHFVLMNLSGRLCETERRCSLKRDYDRTLVVVVLWCRLSKSFQLYAIIAKPLSMRYWTCGRALGCVKPWTYRQSPQTLHTLAARDLESRMTCLKIMFLCKIEIFTNYMVVKILTVDRFHVVLPLFGNISWSARKSVEQSHSFLCFDYVKGSTLHRETMSWGHHITLRNHVKGNHISWKHHSKGTTFYGDTTSRGHLITLRHHNKREPHFMETPVQGGTTFYRDTTSRRTT